MQQYLLLATRAMVSQIVSTFRTQYSFAAAGKLLFTTFYPAAQMLDECIPIEVAPVVFCSV